MKKLKRQKFRYPPQTLFCEETLNAVTLGDVALTAPVFCMLEVFSAKNLLYLFHMSIWFEPYAKQTWRRLEGWEHHLEFQRLQLVLGLAP